MGGDGTVGHVGAQVWASGIGRQSVTGEGIVQVTAVGTDAGGAAGEVCWTLKLPARLGSPTIADAEGSGTLQVVVSCADGFVYGIGPAAKESGGYELIPQQIIKEC